MKLRENQVNGGVEGAGGDEGKGWATERGRGAWKNVRKRVET